jgi:hypothetical protein
VESLTTVSEPLLHDGSSVPMGRQIESSGPYLSSEKPAA